MRKLKIEVSGVMMGYGKPVRFIYDAATDELLGDVYKDFGNTLWCVTEHRSYAPDIPRDKQCHGSYGAAMKFAREYFGGAK